MRKPLSPGSERCPPWIPAHAFEASLVLCDATCCRATRLQLRLGRLQRGQEEVADFAGCFAEVVAHALAAEAFADDVELDAVV